MFLYERERDESLLIKWYYDLAAEPPEFERLFAKPHRNLTAMLSWAANDVKVMLATDAAGIWAAAWVEPALSGAWFGAWVRKDKRGSIGEVAFINRCYATSLKAFPVLIGVTRQKELHDLHLALGYVKVGEIPGWFDGETAYIYFMTQESRLNRHVNERRKAKRIEQQFDVQSLRADSGAVREDSTAAVQGVRESDGGSPQDRRSERADTDHRSEPRRGAQRIFQKLREYTSSVGAEQPR